MEKVCFFMGHKDTPNSVYPKLLSAIKQAASMGVTEFVVGSHGNFDSMAAHAVQQAKADYPAIILTRLQAYYCAASSNRLTHDRLFFPPGLENVPKRYALDRANRYMLHHCSYLIFYAAYPGSHALHFYQSAERIAKKRPLTLINLFSQKHSC